jgi:hypothetical protein
MYGRPLGCKDDAPAGRRYDHREALIRGYVHEVVIRSHLALLKVSDSERCDLVLPLLRNPRLGFIT